MMFPNWFESQKHFFEKYVPQVPLRALQIGAYTGDASMWLLENRQVENLDDVDTWEGSDENAHKTIDFDSVEGVYDSRIKSYTNVNKFKMTSDEFFTSWPSTPPTYNFIYVDGDHTAVQTALDGFNSFRLLEPGGVLAFDDYLWWDNPDEFLRPRKGIDAVLNACSGKFNVLEIGYQAWIQKI